MSTHQGWFEEFQILGLVYFLQTHHVWLELQNLGDRQRPIDRIGYSVEQTKKINNLPDPITLFSFER